GLWRGRAVLEQVLVYLVGVDAVEQDFQIFVAFGLGVLAPVFDQVLDIFTSLLALALVSDVEGINLAELAETAHAGCEFVAVPEVQCQGFRFAFFGLLDIDDGAGDGGDCACGQQVAAQEGVDQGALADAGAPEEDEGIGALVQYLFSLFNAELCLGYSTNQIVTGGVDALLQVDPLLYLRFTDIGQLLQGVFQITIAVSFHFRVHSLKSSVNSHGFVARVDTYTITGFRHKGCTPLKRAALLMRI